MPSYKTHVAVNLFLGLPLSLACMKYMVHASPIDTGSFACAFIYGTLFLHPDLDLARNVRLFSLKGVLTLPFRPYSYLFRHRGMSHLPLIGTLTRVLWLLGMIWLTFALLDWTFPPLEIWENPLLWFAIGGLAASDLLHVFLDHVN